MLKYWRQTLDGLVGLACDAFETPIVLAGEWMLRRWDKQHPNAHDIDMADVLSDVEADQEVWEPHTQKRPLAAVLESMVIATEILADAVEMLEQHIPTTEKTP